MRNQPVYRYPPRSHAYNCPCSRCVQCRRDGARHVGSGLIGFDLAAIAICVAIAGIIWVVLAPLRIWHTIGSDGQEHPDTATWIAYGISGGLIMLLLMFFSIRAANRAGGPR